MVVEVTCRPYSRSRARCKQPRQPLVVPSRTPTRTAAQEQHELVLELIDRLWVHEWNQRLTLTIDT